MRHGAIDILGQRETAQRHPEGRQQDAALPLTLEEQAERAGGGHPTSGVVGRVQVKQVGRPNGAGERQEHQQDQDEREMHGRAPIGKKGGFPAEQSAREQGSAKQREGVEMKPRHGAF